MKILHTYWSKPASKNVDNEFGRASGGWFTEEQHAMSWALSCLKFKQVYKQVELHTDKDGEDWLINKLKLPYSNMVRSLDDFGYSHDLWALAKLKTYSLQTEPFIHADGDVFVWKPIKKSHFEADLIVQNIEFETIDNPLRIYEPAASKVTQEAKHCPQIVTDGLNNFYKTGRFEAYNTGVLGVQNIDFIHQYCSFVFNFLATNKEINYESKDMNFVEQFFLFALSSQKNISVNKLFQPENAVVETSYKSVTKLHFAPFGESYVHLLAAAKKNMNFVNQVSLRLKYEFPKVYNHIRSVYKKSNYHFPIKKASPNSNETNPFQVTLNALNVLEGESHQYSSYLAIKSRVKKLYELNSDSNAIQFLHDTFCIERAIYRSRRPMSIAKTSRKPILDLIYNGSKREILQQKFIFNSRRNSLVQLHFKFPNFKTDQVGQYLRFEKIQQNGISKNAQLSVISIDENNFVRIEALTGANSSISLFENNELNGNELVSILRHAKIKNPLPKDKLTNWAIEFVFNFSLYFDYLKVVRK